MRAQTTKKLVATFTIILLLFLWLQELSRRHARQSTDSFLGPYLQNVNWVSTTISFHNLRRDQEYIILPRWHVRYNSFFAFTTPEPTIQVDMLGRIEATNIKSLTDFIGLPEDESLHRLSEIAVAERSFFESNRLNNKINEDAEHIPPGGRGEAPRP